MSLLLGAPQICRGPLLRMYLSAGRAVRFRGIRQRARAGRRRPPHRRVLRVGIGGRRPFVRPMASEQRAPRHRRRARNSRRHPGRKRSCSGTRSTTMCRSAGKPSRVWESTPATMKPSTPSLSRSATRMWLCSWRRNTRWARLLIKAMSARCARPWNRSAASANGHGSPPSAPSPTSPPSSATPPEARRWTSRWTPPSRRSSRTRTGACDALPWTRPRSGRSPIAKRSSLRPESCWRTRWAQCESRR
mmetsp:Transcript_13246/g.38102  ORF Transcript_13246/g.38102 Transcript_13246/m.38102 type:complete len:247 (-) Transcript_13246:662-1402(-)